MSRHLETTKAQRVPCPRCGDPILFGVAEGYPMTVDVEPISADREYLALLDGKYTVTLNARGELWDRPAWRIRAVQFPGSTIHPQHRCGKREIAEQLPLPLEGMK